MKKKITVKEIKAIANGEANIEDLFPEVFETVLDVGKVYHYNRSGKCLFKITKIENGIIYAYGFNYNYIFKEETAFCKIISSDLYLFVEATPKEWGDELIKEAGRRGFEKGVFFKSLDNENIFVLKGSCLKYGWKNQDCLHEDISAGLIYKDGTWAEIIETITKEEAEKLLNKKIV